MDYARALVEHPMWRWEPGMVTRHQHGSMCETIYRIDDLNLHTVGVDGSWLRYPLPVRYLTPSINHPATKGWLLHMLREATGTQDACATWLGCEWRLHGWIGASALGRFATEGEALAAALLAVWGPA